MTGSSPQLREDRNLDKRRTACQKPRRGYGCDDHVAATRSQRSRHAIFVITAGPYEITMLSRIRPIQYRRSPATRNRYPAIRNHVFFTVYPRHLHVTITRAENND